jgi:hypothetical protein
MKKLIYFPFALFLILLAASCQKNDPLPSLSSPQPPDSVATVSMVNNSGCAYEVAFDGMAKYTADMPANGRQTITVKAGTYNIQVYPTGTYASHTISWNSLAPVISARASFNGVLISSSSSQGLLIY